MKNLLIFAHAGLGMREHPGAPTFWNTVEGFLKRGWKVWVVDVGTKEDTPLGEQVYEDGLYIIRYNPLFLKGERLRKVGYFFHLLNEAGFTRLFLREGRRLIRENGMNSTNTVIYAQEVHSVRACKKLSRQMNMPLVTRFYGTVMCDKPNDLYHRLRDYPHLQAIGTKADLVIMTNDGTKGDRVLKAVRNPSPRQFFWRNGVDIPAYDGTVPDMVKALEPGTHILMTLCRLNAWKHVDRAVTALAEVLKTQPKTVLIICGYGPEREALEQQAAELGISDHVLFTGRIDHDLAFSFLNQADIFLSLYDLSNLGNPLFEAMRCARPIITLDVGATNTLVEDGVNGILLPPDRLDRIPAEICRLLDNETERKKLGESAYRYACENFRTWEQRVNDEVDEVENLLPKE